MPLGTPYLIPFRVITLTPDHDTKSIINLFDQSDKQIKEVISLNQNQKTSHLLFQPSPLRVLGVLRGEERALGFERNQATGRAEGRGKLKNEN
jgi:hypothetical protein